MTSRHLIFTSLFCLSIISSITASTDNTIFQKLQSYEEITLTTNLDSLVINKRTGRYQPAKITLKGANQADLNMNIDIRARGKFRRRTCELPPIKLNFAKSDLKAMGLIKNYDKLKLVTQCELEKNYEQHLLKEYWAYKMYNEVTENSYRVKLFKIKYIDDQNPTKIIESYALILENSKELAERLGGELVPQTYGMNPNQVDANSYDQTIFFNYMIGNTDWDLTVQRNLTIVQKEGANSYTVIPYDFDQSKLVNAPYLAKHPSIKVVRADNRHPMGAISSNESLKQLISDFKENKVNFKGYKNCPHLKKKKKGEITGYLYSFYLELRDKAGLRAQFLAAR